MKRRLPAYFYLLLVAGLVIGNGCVYRAILAPRHLEVSVLDAGEKGSATILRTPSGATVLVNTGPDAGILRALGTTLPFWQRDIGAIFLTSDKAASTGGLADVTSRYRTPNTIRLGTCAVPYGARLMLDDASITVLAPDVFTVSYGAASFSISSSTPPGTYVSDEETFTKTK